MEILSTPLKGLQIVIPQRFGDDRGFFSECWNRRRMDRAGLGYDFVQDNHSWSKERGTVRGLHFQAPPHAQTKLVRCSRGRIFDVAVDIRRGSPTYGIWYGQELSFENGRQMLVPEGFLHGFATLEEGSEIIYKCSDYYAPECEGAVRYDDPLIGIDWQLGDFTARTSDRDAAAPSFADFHSPFVSTDCLEAK